MRQRRGEVKITMRRTKEEALETRRKILESALDIFCSKSYSETTLTEIASHVGLSKGALYWHFRNKNDLLLQLIEYICRQGEETYKLVLEAPDTTDKLPNYYREMFALPLRDDRCHKIHRLMLRRDEWPAEVQEKARMVIKGTMESERRMVEMLTEKGQRDGRIRPDISARAVSALMSSIFHGLWVLQLSDMLPAEFPEYLEILFSAFRKELETAPGQTPLV